MHDNQYDKVSRERFSIRCKVAFLELTARLFIVLFVCLIKSDIVLRYSADPLNIIFDLRMVLYLQITGAAERI